MIINSDRNNATEMDIDIEIKDDTKSIQGEKDTFKTIPKLQNNGKPKGWDI